MSEPTLYVQQYDARLNLAYCVPLTPETCPGHEWVTAAFFGPVSEQWLTPSDHHHPRRSPWLKAAFVYCRYCGAHPEEAPHEPR